MPKKRTAAPKHRRNVEDGAAGITIKLSKGNISVHHEQEGDELARLNNAPRGTWVAIWAALAALGIKRHGC